MKKIWKKFLKQKKLFLILELLGVVLIVGLIIFLIVKKNIEPTNNKKEENTPVEKQEEKEVGIIDVNSKSRPLAIMINNASEARPHQKGLQKAYIVYEIINYADGATRFLALYKDVELDEIGPIRSARHYHLDYVLENDAIYVHWGYSPQAESDIKSLKINNVNGMIYGNTYFWTADIKGVNISHRRFTSTELLNKGISKLKYKTETETDNLLKYIGNELNNNEFENTKTANKVSIYYSKSNYSSYQYDEESKAYLRSVKGVAHKDASTNEQLQVKNIITYKVKNTTIPGDYASRQELHNVGEGKGYYITNGYATEIKWSKECRSCQTKYTYLNGEEVIFNDGNTFIQIQPEDQKLDIS